jgi:AraC-like DNA-binding protein
MLICSVRERRIQANWREIIDLVGFAGCFIGFIFKQLVSSNAFEIVYFTYLLIYFCSSALIVIHRSKNQTKPIEEKIQVDVMDRIHNGFKTLFEEEKIYLDATLNLRHLTKRLQSNEKYVSSYINTTYNMSFTSFVNRCRVDEAKRLLLDLKNAQFTIETIAQMAGFQNKSTFNLAFKKETGETPSQFKAKNLS